jgi:hypothetical protein
MRRKGFAAMTENINPLSKLNLWQKLVAISEEAGMIEKTGRNRHFDYKFTEHANIMAHYRPILARYGVAIDLEAMDAEFIGDKGKVKINMRYYVTNTDKPEENFSRLWVSEANDGQDKGINKALTAAEKNVFMKLFHISDIDLEADENEQPKTQDTKQSENTPALVQQIKCNKCDKTAVLRSGVSQKDKRPYTGWVCPDNHWQWPEKAGA